MLSSYFSSLGHYSSARRVHFVSESSGGGLSVTDEQTLWTQNGQSCVYYIIVYASTEELE